MWLYYTMCVYECIIVSVCVYMCVYDCVCLCVCARARTMCVKVLRHFLPEFVLGAARRYYAGNVYVLLVRSRRFSHTL